MFPIRQRRGHAAPGEDKVPFRVEIFSIYMQLQQPGDENLDRRGRYRLAHGVETPPLSADR